MTVETFYVYFLLVVHCSILLENLKEIRLYSREALNVTLFGKRVFADVIKLHILRWVTWIFWVDLTCQHRCLCEREADKDGGEQCVSGQGVGRVGHKLRNAAVVSHWKSQGEDSRQGCQRQGGPATLILVRWNWFWSSAFQNCVRINFSCFKTPSWW